MSVRVTVNGSLRVEAEKAAQAATKAVMAELNGAFQQSFTAKAWQWPRDLPDRKLKGATLAEKIASYNRGEGIRGGSPRNIIDSDNLRQTGSWRMSGPYEATFAWSADYATAVHEGAMIYPWGNKKARRVHLPARPWTRAVTGQENVPGVEVYNLGERLQNVWLAYMRARG